MDVDPAALEDAALLEEASWLEDCVALEEPATLDEPATLEEPTTLDVPAALEETAALEDPADALPENVLLPALLVPEDARDPPDAVEDAPPEDEEEEDEDDDDDDEEVDPLSGGSVQAAANGRTRAQRSSRERKATSITMGKAQPPRHVIETWTRWTGKTETPDLPRGTGSLISIRARTWRQADAPEPHRGVPFSRRAFAARVGGGRGGR